MNIILFLITIKLVLCKDYYRGIFRRDDFLVAQDNLYKAKRPHGYAISDYGRMFKCPITYFRIVDRLGVGNAPIVKVVRGGILKKYIVCRIRSAYNMPLSVNIYVGCENKAGKRPITVPWRKSTSSVASETTVSGNATDGNTDGNATTATGGTATDGGTGATGATGATEGTGPTGDNTETETTPTPEN